eukprot:TRINITY_DN750_c0_g1_i2.p1 TRINITY_DN750_c0_g1~~TRINITY_DN750_c0_g1_i2.p1  ORF type:complete len:273 (+),score=94.61 TRINITY_DN750_c0_g1_i2:64-882(+)
MIRKSVQKITQALRKVKPEEIVYEGKFKPNPFGHIEQKVQPLPDIEVPTRPGRQVLNALYLQYKELYNRHRTIVRYNNVEPVMSNDTFIAPSATILGNVMINDRASVWYNSVLRADRGYIEVGAYTNVQDGVTITADDAKDAVTGLPYSTIIGNYVTIGHGAILHGCRIQNEAFIGMNAVVMEGAVVESGAMVAAGAVVPPGRRVPSGELWAGNPARCLRPLTYEEKASFLTGAEEYWKSAEEHKAEFYLPESTSYLEVEKLASQVEAKLAQ